MQEIDIKVGLVSLKNYPVSNQLKDQGFEVDNPVIYQTALESVGRLRVAGFLTDNEAIKACNRIVRQLARNCKLL